MINSEQLFDMLPTVVEIYDKLDLDTYLKKIGKENKVKKLNDKAVGIELFKYVLKNSGKIKEDMFEIVAVFQEITIEEAKTQSFGKTIKTIKEVFTDEEATVFFKQAIQ